MKIVVILDNIRSAHNVGAIFRTADGAGVSKIYLCGYTPRPIDRFGRVQPEIAKTSLGATELVAWEAVDDIVDIIDRLKADGYIITAVEQHKTSVSYADWKPGTQVGFIFGNEIEGVQSAALRAADTIIEIPMRGERAQDRRTNDIGKESLNVSTSVGIILFHFMHS